MGTKVSKSETKYQPLRQWDGASSVQSAIFNRWWCKAAAARPTLAENVTDGEKRKDIERVTNHTSVHTLEHGRWERHILKVCGRPRLQVRPPLLAAHLPV